jgi:hypothetical protein
MRANATVVARGIASSEGDEQIKKCLLALFNFELANTNVRNPQYKEKYREIIEANSKDWDGISKGASK